VSTGSGWKRWVPQPGNSGSSLIKKHTFCNEQFLHLQMLNYCNSMILHPANSVWLPAGHDSWFISINLTAWLSIAITAMTWSGWIECCVKLRATTASGPSDIFQQPFYGHQFLQPFSGDHRSWECEGPKNTSPIVLKILKGCYYYIYIHIIPISSFWGCT